MRVLLIVFSVFAVHPLATAAVADTTDTETNTQLDAAEQALVELMADYYGELEIWWEALRDYETSAAREEVIAAGELVDPGVRYVPRLLAFEAEHRGETVGLLALWHIFRQAGSTARFNAPAVTGRPEAAKRLINYEQNPLLSLVAKTALIWKPQVYDSVEKLCSSPTIPASTRDIVRLNLAIHALQNRKAREYSVRRVDILRAGGKPTWVRELENRLAMLEVWPSADVVNERCINAIRSLEELAEKKNSPQLPKSERVDNHGYVIRLSKKNTQPLVAETAAAALFKERHLVVGAKAPSLDVSLLDGTTWRMTDQVGKVVVIQFSFTGCGPCELTYPGLAALAAEYPDRLEILTLMRDATPDSAVEATESGKLTWSVALDGHPGRITTKWFVSSFPTIYVIDTSGSIAAENVRGDSLRKEVARLVGEDE